MKYITPLVQSNERLKWLFLRPFICSLSGLGVTLIFLYMGLNEVVSLLMGYYVCAIAMFGFTLEEQRKNKTED